MKLQCACGAKYAFEVQPEMLCKPVKFVCVKCGQDWSAYVDNLVRQELLGGGAPIIPIEPVAVPETAIAPPPDIAPPPAPAAVAPPPSAAPPAPAASAPLRVRMHTGAQNPADLAASTTDARFCSKHPAYRVTENCVVCGKAICPKCMEVFGYVCSPLCKQKAELQGIEVPEFAGQKAVVERRRWRKVGLATAALSAVVVAFLGVWIWFAWFGSHPHPAFSVRFDEVSYSGQSRLCGKDQIVFLHGDTLARYDMKSKKEIWSRQLVDKSAIDQQVEKAIKALRAAQDKLNNEAPDADPIKIPPPDKLARSLAREAAAELELYVRGQNIWVSSADKLVRYDWATGQAAQELPLQGGLGGAIARGDEMLLLKENDSDRATVTHINLATGQKRDEEIGEPIKSVAATSPAAKGKAGGSKSLDPEKIAAQVQNMPLPGKIALPATLSVARNQERALAELRGQDNVKAGPAASPSLQPEFANHFSLVPSPDGFVEFSVNLLESKVVQRSAMKSPPKKSALDGPVNMAATADVANEILNEIQRDRGGDVVEEDESRYAVAVRIPGAKDATEWKGEVVGTPALHPLKTVNVIAAGKTLVVLDKTNKKKWSGTLTYPVGGSGDSLDEESASFGLGPCVERGDTLYVIDQGVLTAFDLASGNARWRLPSVGIAGLFFDDQGMIYVNTTTASPEKIKYSKQIDVTDKTSSVVLKLDPKTGKTLWNAELGGLISHLSGKFIYTIQSYQPDGGDADNPYVQETGFEKPPHMRIKRINPKNGRVMWTHYQERAPLDVQFDKNTINLVFKKEVQVLKFLSF